MHLIGLILISIATIAVTVVLFIGWAVTTVVRTIFRVIFPNRAPRAMQAIRSRFNAPAGVVRCTRSNCRNANPATARFCRCCGTNLIASGATISRPLRERMTA